MIRDDRDRGDGAGMPSEEASALDGRGHRMRALFDEILGLDADSRTRALRAAAARDGLDDEIVDEVRGLLAFVDATRIDDDEASEIDDRPDRLLGCRVGAFTLERLVGIGGTAAVFEATQDRPRRRVAVKVLRHAIGGRRAKRRFEREIEIAGRLDHPAIARVYDSGSLVVDGVDTPWLAMEYVANARTITAHARDRGLDLRGRVGLVREALAGVAAAHRRGVIHRDLKPANILVDEKGRVRVIDFGIARQASGPIGGMTATLPGQVIGTVPFMAPEQLDGDPDAVDVGTDVYAIGVTMHLLLTGRMPYEIAGCSFVEAARRIREVEVGSLRRFDRAIDRDLDGIVQKALEKAPARRYRTIEALDADLEAWLAGMPVEARPLGSLARGVRVARRHPLPTAAGGIAVLSLVATIVVLAVMLGRESTLRARGDRAAANAGLAAAAAAVDRGAMSTARRHLTLVPFDERGWGHAWLTKQCDRSDHAVHFTSSDIISVDVAPSTDRRPELLLATGYRGTAAWTLPEVELLWQLPEFSAGGCWKHILLPAGDRLVVVGLGAELAVVDLDTGEAVARHETPGSVGALWPAGDDRVVLGGDDGVLSIMDLATGRVERSVDPEEGNVTAMLGLADGRIIVGTSDGTILETDPRLDRVQAVRRYDRMVPRIRADGDERRLVVCTHGDFAEVVDARDYSPIIRLDDHLADVWDARFDPDRNRLVTASLDESVRVFDLETGRTLDRVAGPYGYVWSLAIESDGRHVWAGTHDGSVRRLRLFETSPTAPDGEEIEALAWSFDDASLYVLTTASIRLFDPTRGIWTTALARPASIAGTTREHGLLVATDAAVWYWNGPEGGLLRSSLDLSAHQTLLQGRTVRAIAGLPDGGVLVATDELQVHQLNADGREVATVDVPRRPGGMSVDSVGGEVWCVHFGSGDGYVLGLDPLRMLRVIPPGYSVGPSFDIELSPDAATVVVGGRERPGNICISKRGDPATRVRRVGHSGDPHYIVFLDGGDRLVTAGGDGRVILSRPFDTEPLLLLEEFAGPVRGLAATRDGLALAMSDGRRVVVHRVPSREDRARNDELTPPWMTRN